MSLKKIRSLLQKENLIDSIDTNNVTENTKIEIQDLLEAAQNVDMDYLGEKTLESISEDVVRSLDCLNLSNEQCKSICEKLVSYRFVDQIYQLHKGKHIRWIRIQSTSNSTAKPLQLTNGGIVIEISFTDNGTIILCKNFYRFVKIKFDDCLIYQKLTENEQLILTCSSYVKKL